MGGSSRKSLFAHTAGFRHPQSSRSNCHTDLRKQWTMLPPLRRGPMPEPGPSRRACWSDVPRNTLGPTALHQQTWPTAIIPSSCLAGVRLVSHAVSLLSLAIAGLVAMAPITPGRTRAMSHAPFSQAKLSACSDMLDAAILKVRK